jgi:serine/threonine protein kinase
VALGLQYLHNLNIIHGDVKPTNIGKKLCDFGFSTKLNSKSEKKLRACGTPVFMAPEIVNRIPYGTEVDCWSFAICLLLWFKGAHPYKAKTEQ